MKKLLIFFFFVLIIKVDLKAQRYALFNTHTLFDTFENPAQRSFLSDYTGQHASNFLLPDLDLNFGNRGDASYTFRKRLNDGYLDTRNIPAGNNDRNIFYGSTNIYLLTYRVFNPSWSNRELGFSWQLRSDVYADYTNESVIALRNYSRLTSAQEGLFNGNGYGQSYHQFSMDYREDIDEYLSFGFKVSVLSGITYNQADIVQSGLKVDGNKWSVGLTGSYKASFLLTDELNTRTLLPEFKNPGFSVSLGTSYTAPSGVFVMGNLKDLGFIRWNNNSSSVLLNDVISVNGMGNSNSKLLQQKIVDLLKDNNQRKSFYTPTNAKADFMVSKDYGFYRPGFVASKNIFYRGGDLVFVNSFRFSEFSASLSPGYNLNQFALLGLQGMYQDADFEFYLGTDNLLQSASIFKETSYTDTGSIGASFYMGFGIKF